MERGFDKLMTPGGLLILCGSAFMLIAVIAFGAAMFRIGEERRRRERAAAAKCDSQGKSSDM